MARYTVLMTFEVSGPQAALTQKSTLGGRGSIRMLAADGTLAVSAAGVRAETGSEAAMQIATEVGRRWGKGRGPLRLSSWRANRERVLVGVRRRRPDSVQGFGPWPDGFPGSDSSDWPDDEGGDGSAGVREPRRPKPGPGSLSMEAELP
jgi:hypothetical protein